MKYVAYHRTSTKDQHLDRGLAEITKYCKDNDIPLYKNKIYTDQQTGKNFNRPRYQMLKEEILEATYFSKLSNFLLHFEQEPQCFHFLQAPICI